MNYKDIMVNQEQIDKAQENVNALYEEKDLSELLTQKIAYKRHFDDVKSKIAVETNYNEKQNLLIDRQTTYTIVGLYDKAIYNLEMLQLKEDAPISYNKYQGKDRSNFFRIKNNIKNEKDNLMKYRPAGYKKTIEILDKVLTAGITKPSSNTNKYSNKEE